MNATKDVEFVTLVDKYEKSLELLEIVSKSLYDERAQVKRLEREVADLTENFQILMPNHAHYYKDRALQAKLEKFTIADACGSWRRSER